MPKTAVSFHRTCFSRNFCKHFTIEHSTALSNRTMDFYNLFKSFLGIPNSVPPQDFRFDEYNHDYPDNYDQHDGIIQPHGPGHQDEDVNWYNFMENPMELHRFIEEQMQHLMSSFGMGSGGSLLDDSFTSQHPQQPSSLREQFLKPGFDHPSTSKADTDMDGRVNIEELDTVLKPTQVDPMPVTPYSKPRIKTHFFGQSMSTKTIMKPDGTVETTKTVTDNAGNRETTVTRRDRTSEHTVITKIGANGEETREERMVHLEGQGQGQFDDHPRGVIPHPHAPLFSQSWFDSFLK